MNQTEMTDKISERTGMSKADVKRVLDAFVDIATGAFKDGKCVKLSAFGSFRPVFKKERGVRNPRTGEMMTIDSCNSVKFSISANLKDALN